MQLSPVPALRKGDTIAVIAPSGPVPLAELKKGLGILGAHFKLRVAPDIDRKQGFLAGSDERRIEELNVTLRDPEVRGIWAARGGYGASRILDKLDASAFQADPVPIVGFSDITALLSWAAKLGFRSIHGPVLTQLGKLDAIDAKSVLDLAMGTNDSLWAEGLDGPDAAGVMLGGNLCLLAHLVGSAWEPNYRDALVVAEDVGERPYALDRMLRQLLARTEPAHQPDSSLRAASALLLGDFAECREKSDPSQDAIADLARQAKEQGLAVIRNLPLGHGSRNRAFPFGAPALISAGRLELVEGAVQ